ncbi:MAG: glutaredoxin family protein [Sterolibacterium sp.]
MTINKPRLTLYSRAYCHLCEDMLGALEQLRAEHVGGFDIEVVDVDADPLLLPLYDELVPVLAVVEVAEVHELCHYFLDKSAVLAYLDAVGQTP